MIIDLIKSERRDEATAKITGVISTEDVDLQGEIVKQAGLDFSHFEANGVLNYEHQKGAANVLGYPLKIKRDPKKKCTTIEGLLLLKQPKAREIFTLAQAMEKAGRSRSIGFSVEGSVLERDPHDPKIVTKARVLNCAITTSPVNPQTSMTLIKALIKKGEIGYQTPAANGESLAALIPQQLGQGLSVADSDTLRMDRQSRIISALSLIFPHAATSQIEALAREILQELS